MVRGSRRERGRAVEALGAALQHHAEVPRRRPHEAQEAAAAMGGARGVARARGLDHVMQVGGVSGGVGGVWGGAAWGWFEGEWVWLKGGGGERLGGVWSGRGLGVGVDSGWDVEWAGLRGGRG